MKKENRGGARPGSGRPSTNLKTFTIRCYPDVIKQVRETVKQINDNYEK